MCLLGGHPDRVVGCPRQTRRRVPQDERARSVRIGCREHRGHDSAFPASKDRRPLRAGRVHDRSDVVHPLLQPGKRAQGCRVGQADAVLIEGDHATEGAQTPEESLEGRDFWPALEMKEPLRDEHEVDLALTQYLVRDVNFTAPCVSALREHIQENPARPVAWSSRGVHWASGLGIAPGHGA